MKETLKNPFKSFYFLMPLYSHIMEMHLYHFYNNSMLRLGSLESADSTALNKKLKEKLIANMFHLRAWML